LRRYFSTNKKRPAQKRGAFRFSATATVVATEKRSERAVFAEAVGERREYGPTAPRKYARGEHVSARAQDKQDNENPKTAVVAGHAAIHKFPPSPQGICIVFLSAVLY